jgi:hypothetical protein
VVIATVKAISQSVTYYQHFKPKLVDNPFLIVAITVFHVQKERVMGWFVRVSN